MENLELNGNNFISEEIITDDVFAGNLGKITITNGENTEIFTDMMLYNNRVDGGKTWFVLGEKTEQQKTREEIALLHQMIEMLLSGVTADE